MSFTMLHLAMRTTVNETVGVHNAVVLFRSDHLDSVCSNETVVSSVYYVFESKQNNVNI